MPSILLETAGIGSFLGLGVSGGRKAHLLEDKKILSVGVFDEVFSTWMAFGGNTLDLGSFGEEIDKITDLHQIHEEVLLTEHGDGVTGIKRRHHDPSSDSAADRVAAPTPDSTITILEVANEFAIKGNHLTLVKRNQFDGRIKTDPHKHIYEFLEICDMFKYKDIENEAVRLMMFPLSLTGEAKTWLDELNE
uniref:Reverse transcriptase domain-containing protein n=1 Tax=Tanacetum cinerariifolium TaxID=118510 RepID=A0A699I0H9_TANCI|nr:reverse transcriptase domain-containing protein [Tanacetum cinerariifolium]